MSFLCQRRLVTSFLSSCSRHPQVQITRHASNSGRVAPSQQATKLTYPKPKVVFSGIQPSGVPHLGNLLGALLNWVNLQKYAGPDDQLIYSIVGWHALTLPQDPATLSTMRWDMIAVLLSVGLDPSRSIIFHQDQNPDHLELAWLLNCITPMGKLQRMTTWKSRLAASRNARDDSEVDESLLNAGLFTYPVLQAADIMLYRATHVPVGEDQQQHIELCRDLAEIFNRTCKGDGPLFPLPEHVITSSPRILSLKDPSSKMSKSSPNLKSRILFTDSSDTVRSKIRGAVTDSTFGVTFDPDGRPGVTNLLSILAACTGENAEAIAARYANKGHGDLKDDVADAVEELMRNPREEFHRLRQDTKHLDTVANIGAQSARVLSSITLQEVRRRVGLV